MNNEPGPAEFTEGSQARQRQDVLRDVLRNGAVMATKPTVDLHGSAATEFIKAFTGVDRQTGETFSKSLQGIGQYKLNSDPHEMAKNLHQQAGFSAEVAATARDNAEAHLRGDRTRTMRSDDLKQYGSNHNVVDRVQVLDGLVVEGSEAQMKFVGDRDLLFSRIAREDGKFARYRGVKLELPTEQYEQARDFCQKQAQQLRQGAARARTEGRGADAERLLREAANYEDLGKNVRDSGLTMKEAMFYRTHPGLATLRDMAGMSHRAGLQGATYGAVIGGSISVVKQAIALAQKKASFQDAATEMAKDVATAGAVGYGTAFVGTAAKAAMQQSRREGLRVLAHTSAPTLALNVCISLGGSIRDYVRGDINEVQLLETIGEKSTGMLASGMMAALGQVAVPIPFVGAALGGMVGTAIASAFYTSAVDAARAAKLSRSQLVHVEFISMLARARIAEEQASLDAFVACEMPRLHAETRALFVALDAPAGDVATAINGYAELLGKHLQFASNEEFDAFMASAEPLRL